MRGLRAFVCGVAVAAVSVVAGPVESSSAAPAGPTPMLITIKRNGLGNQTIRLPLDNEAQGTSFTVDWDVGNNLPTCAATTVTVLVGSPLPDLSCTYVVGDAAATGSKTISITPAAGQTIRRFGSNDATDGASFFTGVLQWGDLGFESLDGAFFNMANLTTVPNVLPTSVTDLSYTFFGASAFNQDIGSWDTSHIERMQGTFRNASTFNRSLNTWDVGEVVTMDTMFDHASSFNNGAASGACNVELDWGDSEKLGQTSYMFSFATAFNATLTLDTSDVTTMESMFYAATAFNNGCIDSGVAGSAQPLNLDTGINLTFKNMFRFATSFNQDISHWNVLEVRNLDFMFSHATAFDVDLSGWCFNYPVDHQDFAVNAGFANTPYKHPSWDSCPTPAPPAATPIVPVWHSTLDPAGGTCGVAPSAHTIAWTEAFVGYRYLPAADDCHRDGFEFVGWASAATPQVATSLPLIVDPTDGVARYFVAGNVDYVAVWRTFPGPSEFMVFGNFLCKRCTDEWLMWRAPSGAPVDEIVVDDRGANVCTNRTITWADWRFCPQTGLTPGTTHTYSLHFRRGTAVSTTSTTTITLRNR